MNFMFGFVQVEHIIYSTSWDIHDTLILYCSTKHEIKNIGKLTERVTSDDDGVGGVLALESLHG